MGTLTRGSVEQVDHVIPGVHYTKLLWTTCTSSNIPLASPHIILPVIVSAQLSFAKGWVLITSMFNVQCAMFNAQALYSL